HDRIGAREAREGDIDRLGRVLFEALLGETIWSGVIESAKSSPGASLIEIALSWAATDASLTRLNWELMRNKSGFLAAGSSYPIAITRVVPGAQAVFAVGSRP